MRIDLSPLKRPKYCTVCGKELIVNDKRTEKFDPFTGEAYKVGFLELQCPDFEYRNAHNHMMWDVAKETPTASTTTWGSEYPFPGPTFGGGAGGTTHHCGQNRGCYQGVRFANDTVPHG